MLVDILIFSSGCALTAATLPLVCRRMKKQSPPTHDELIACIIYLRDRMKTFAETADEEPVVFLAKRSQDVANSVLDRVVPRD